VMGSTTIRSITLHESMIIKESLIILRTEHHPQTESC